MLSCFSFSYMGLSQLSAHGYKVSGLTQVDPIFFCFFNYIFYFNHSRSVCFIVDFHGLIQFVFICDFFYLLFA